MEQIKNILPKLAVDLAQPTKVSQPSTLALAKFDSFLTFGDPQLERMKYECARFVSDFRNEREPRWLSLLGTSGAGKTMLAKIIGRLCWHSWTDEWNRIVRWLREGKFGKFYDLFDDEILILDDIGAEYETDFIKAKMYELLANRSKKWTVLTANYSMQQISERFDPRIASRMIRHGSTVIDIDVPDFNLRSAPVPEVRKTTVAE